MRKYSKRKFVKNKRPSGKAKGSRIKKRKSTNRTKNRGKNRKRTMRGGEHPWLESGPWWKSLTERTKNEIRDEWDEWFDFRYKKDEAYYNQKYSELVGKNVTDNELLHKTAMEYVIEQNRIDRNKKEGEIQMYTQKHWPKKNDPREEPTPIERELISNLGLEKYPPTVDPTKIGVDDEDNSLKLLQKVESLICIKNFNTPKYLISNIYKGVYQKLIAVEELKSLISPVTVPVYTDPELELTEPGKTEFENFLEALDKLQADTRRETLTTLLAKQKDKSITTEETNVLRILIKLTTPIPPSRPRNPVAAEDLAKIALELDAPEGFRETPTPRSRPRPIPAPRSRPNPK